MIFLVELPCFGGLCSVPTAYFFILRQTEVKLLKTDVNYMFIAGTQSCCRLGVDLLCENTRSGWAAYAPNLNRFVHVPLFPCIALVCAGTHSLHGHRSFSLGSYTSYLHKPMGEKNTVLCLHLVMCKGGRQKYPVTCHCQSPSASDSPK